MKPIVAVTMGDPAGVGPEIVAKAFSSDGVFQACRPVAIGDADVMTEGLKVAHVQLDIHPIKRVSEARFEFGTIDIIDLKNIQVDKLRMGEPQPTAGKAAVEYVRKAVELALAGEIHAITTAPLSKAAMNMAGYRYAGHTELLADLTGTKEYNMMLVTRELRVIHVTTHVSLREACDMIKKNRVLSTIRLVDEAMKDFGIEKPRIAVAGLNPHAGEDGLFGKEEIEEIIPAVNASKELGIDVTGPYPADTVFSRAKNHEFDVVVAMYHDQGHIPVKVLGFETGVNLSIGIPIIRTSVDHGTAYRRAGLRLGTADPSSLVEAIKLAAKLAQTKSRH